MILCQPHPVPPPYHHRILANNLLMKAVLNAKTKICAFAHFFQKIPHVHHLLGGNSWPLPFGNWRFVALGGSWWWLGCGSWRLVAAAGRGLVVDGGLRWLAVGGSSSLAIGGGWQLAVGGGL